MERELRGLEQFTTKAEARGRVDEYNRARRHTALGMCSPIDDELTGQVA